MPDHAFTVRIWGARGSISVPAAPNCAYGSDTCCVEMRCGSHVLIFDAGTGAAALGQQLQREGIEDFDLFFSHCHLDHIVGLPFIKPLYRTDTKARLYAGHFEDDTTCRQMVENFMKPPFFPLTPKNFHCDLTFRDFRPPDVLRPRPGITVRTTRIPHPNGAVGYRVEYGGHVVCYVTDTEHTPGEPNEDIIRLIENADIVIYDATYSDAEFMAYRGYGHSTWEEGVRLCEAAGARRLVIFHHKPDRDDQALRALETEAQLRFPGAIVGSTGLELRPDQDFFEEQWRRKA